MLNNKLELTSTAAVYIASVALITLGANSCTTNGASALAIAGIAAGTVGTIFTMYKVIDKGLRHLAPTSTVGHISTATVTANAPMEAPCNATFPANYVHRAGYVADDTPVMTNT